MSRQRLTLALTRFREASEEFDAILTDLRQEMLTMNARLRAFDRQMGEIGRGIDELHGKSVALGRIMDRAMEQTVKKDHTAEASPEGQLEAIT